MGLPRYAKGVERLEGAGAEIGGMQRELERLRPQLLATAEDTAQLITRIEHETVEVCLLPPPRLPLQ